MDVFTHLGDTVSDLYSARYAGDHSLQSPDLSASGTSPQSIFMYEHDNEPASYSKPSIEQSNIRGAVGNPLFEAPWYEEMGDLRCGLGDSFMSESSLCGSSLNDSVKDSLWDFASYDDVSSPLQHPEDDLLHSPTLAELNMEDTPSFDMLASQQHSAFSTQQPHQKTKPVLIKQSSHRHRPAHDMSSSLRRKVQQIGSSSRDQKYSSLFTVAKSNPLPSNLHPKKSLSLSSQSLHNKMTTESHEISHPNHTSLSSNCLSFTNLLGRRTRTFATSPSREEQPKIVVKTEPTDDRVDETSMDRKWEEIRTFIHQDTSLSVKKEELSDEDVSLSTKMTFKKHAYGYSVKNEKTEYGQRNSSDDGFDSHDEGLGSEQEEMEEGSDDASDMSDGDDDTGMVSSTIPAPTGKYRAKSRRSEYDDMTPNPCKLLHIGNELRKLNKVISDMAPVSELSGSARNRCRKEKNKLASRACRLKKKAQHEANKIKLSGLEDEHNRLMVVLSAIKKDMVLKVQRPDIQDDSSLTHTLDLLIKENLGQMVAGHTNEYVNIVMERTARDKSPKKNKLKGS